MNVSTIEMPKEEARARLTAYREALRDHVPTKEDRGIVIGLTALAKGKAILDLEQTFANCPISADGLPMLALARAHWRWTHFRSYGRGGGRFNEQAWQPGRRRAKSRIEIRSQIGNNSYAEGRALVPLIPLNLRPKERIEDYLILFEAEWQPVPPKDPMLLRHLHGRLYVILAAWDLTDLERAVLAGRLREGER